MYSVQDLLISHGYKLPGNAPSPCEGHSADCHREIAGNRSGHGTANGYETDTGAYVCSSLVPAKGYSSDNECRERNQRRQAGSGYHGDTQPLGDSLATDSGFYDEPRGMYSQQRDGRDVSYWRRRGQDFSVLLDYTDDRELRGSAFTKAGGMWRAQRLSAEVLGREKHRWDDGTCPRDGDMWVVTEDRKCQSLGTEDWQPTVELGRQLCDGEGERWAREQRRLAGVGDVAHTGPRGKSQSLPRVLSPECLQHVEMPASGPSSFTSLRINGSLSQGPYSMLYTEGSSRDGPASLLPKPRFSRPLKPPSYEAHQQTRGSSEMLAGDPGAQPKDNALHSPRGGGVSRPDFLAQDPAGSNTEPPVYIPPPSYKRPLLQRGNQKSSGEVLLDFKWKGEPFQQMPGNRELGKWSSRLTGSSWLDYQKDKSITGRKQVCSGHTGEHLGCVQYIPFDDPRVRHISAGICGNSLTYSENIRSISKELPRPTVFEQSSHNSAFLPLQGHNVNKDNNKRSQSELDNENRRCSGLQKANDNSAVFDQSCNKNQTYTAFQTTSSVPNASLDQGFCETITQVKKIEPCTDTENKKNSKRKVNETIFCLVSIPIHSKSEGNLSDQNNNKRITNSVGGSIDNSRGQSQNQSLLSTSSSDFSSEQHTLKSGVLSFKGRKRSSQRKAVWTKPILLLNKSRELQYPGSWPGDQYRDQETQTSSPEAQKGPPQGLPNQQAQDQGPKASDKTTDSGKGTDCNNRYGYQMKGQKSLNPSSNSAFSRMTNFPSQLNKSKTQPPQPSGNQEEVDYHSSRKCDKPTVSTGPEAFGQFLLKPVSRRPWDAIEELESFNKELQEQFSQPPNVNQCIEDLDEAYRNIMELSKSSNNIENNKLNILDEKTGTVSLSDEPLNPTKKTGFETWTAIAHLEYREVRSAFSKPAGKIAGLNRQLRDEVAEAGIPDQGVTGSISQKTLSEPKPLKADIAVPRESLLKDVGLTVYTEAPGAPKQVMHDASTLTSPPDYEDVCQALQLSRERVPPPENKFRSLSTGPPTTLKALGHVLSSRSDSNFSKTVSVRKTKKGNSLPKFSGEKILNVIMVKRQIDRFHSRGGTRCIVSDDPDENETRELVACDDVSGRFDWRKQLSLAEKHLETLLHKEKANSMPAEDLSKLYEVKCAEGIPENESIEERAARILGIDVPAESLGVVESKVGKQAEEVKKTNDDASVIGGPLECSSEKQMHVSSLCEEVSKKSVLLNGQEGETGEATETSKDKTHSKGMGTIVRQNPGLAECPENKLVPSVRANAGGECKGRGPSRVIEVLQGKLATSACRAVAERLARMREIDSVSRMRRLSFRKSASGEEVEHLAAAEATSLEQSLPDQPQLSIGTIVKREITLPTDLSGSSKRAELQDSEAQPLSDSYDPSQVEKV